MKISAVLKKSPALAVALMLLPHFAFAVTPTQRDWWYTLQRGQIMFSRGDYGNARLAFEDARRNRRAVFDRMERDLVDVLSLPEFRRLGDSLDLVETHMRNRHHTAALAALEELRFRFPGERFGNSANAALAALGTLRYFPEAEMWIGKTFLAGGELGLALRQFQLALSQRHLFDNPALATDLLYEIAEIHRLRREFNEMEAALLAVLGDSVLWTGAGQGWQAGDFARQAMTRTLTESGVERFLALYRYGNAQAMRAHRELGFYYVSLGRHQSAQPHLMFAFLIQNTVIIDELIRRRFDFSFTTLEALAAEIDRDPLLSAYAEEIGYYRVAFYLGNALFGSGHHERGRELWRFVASRSAAGQWQARASSQLRSPQIGPTIVMP